MRGHGFEVRRKVHRKKSPRGEKRRRGGGDAGDSTGRERCAVHLQRAHCGWQARTAPQLDNSIFYFFAPVVVFPVVLESHCIDVMSSNRRRPREVVSPFLKLRGAASYYKVQWEWENGWHTAGRHDVRLPGKKRPPSVSRRGRKKKCINQRLTKMAFELKGKSNGYLYGGELQNRSSIVNINSTLQGRPAKITTRKVTPGILRSSLPGKPRTGEKGQQGEAR